MINVGKVNGELINHNQLVIITKFHILCICVNFSLQKIFLSDLHTRLHSICIFDRFVITLLPNTKP